ncbi:MAG: hypothetical protein HZA54_13365 [Planctomycetes bacterium]|nr:hypothetical protein [Planctomycetota bacterium]
MPTLEDLWLAKAVGAYGGFTRAQVRAALREFMQEEARGSAPPLGPWLVAQRKLITRTLVELTARARAMAEASEEDFLAQYLVEHGHLSDKQLETARKTHRFRGGFQQSAGTLFDVLVEAKLLDTGRFPGLMVVQALARVHDRAQIFLSFRLRDPLDPSPRGAVLDAEDADAEAADPRVAQPLPGTSRLVVVAAPPPVGAGASPGAGTGAGVPAPAPAASGGLRLGFDEHFLQTAQRLGLLDAVAARKLKAVADNVRRLRQLPDMPWIALVVGAMNHATVRQVYAAIGVAREQPVPSRAIEPFSGSTDQDLRAAWLAGDHGLVDAEVVDRTVDALVGPEGERAGAGVTDLLVHAGLLLPEVRDLLLGLAAPICGLPAPAGPAPVAADLQFVTRAIRDYGLAPRAAQETLSIQVQFIRRQGHYAPIAQFFLVRRLIPTEAIDEIVAELARSLPPAAAAPPPQETPDAAPAAPAAAPAAGEEAAGGEERLGEELVRRGRLRMEDLQDCLEAQRRMAEAGVAWPLGEILVAKRHVTLDDLDQALAGLMGSG